MALSGVLSLETPTIDYPYNARSFTTNRSEFLISGKAPDASSVEINGSSENVTLNTDTGEWTAKLSLVYGDNEIQVVSRTLAVVYDLVYDDSSSPIILPEKAEHIRVYLVSETYYSAVPSAFYTEGIDYEIVYVSGVPQIEVLPGGTLVGNSFKIKYSLDIWSSPAYLNIGVVTTKETSFSVSPPVNVKTLNFFDRVEVHWTELNDPRVQGYLVYMSSEPQGGSSAKYQIITSSLVDTPVEKEEIRREIEELVEQTRKLSDEVGAKVVDSNFSSFNLWQSLPSDTSVYQTTYRSKPALAFSSGSDYGYAVHKLRYDFFLGTRSQLVLEKNPNEIGNAKAGLVIGDANQFAIFDPSNFISMIWDASSGIIECYTPTESFTTDPGAFSISDVTLDIVTREDKRIEFYANGERIFTSINSVDDTYLISVPISVVGQSGVVARTVFFTYGEYVDVIEVSSTEVELDYVDNYKFTMTKEDFPILENGPVYIVVTAVGFDDFQKEEVESLYSDEVKGELLPTIRTIENYPTRTQSDIRSEYIQSLLDIDPFIDPKPGSVVSDILIGPPSVEIERAFILLDFISRTQSFISLLEIDYDKFVQVDVEKSEYKQKLKDSFDLTDEEVQDLIDAAFERLAANSHVFRKDATPATGSITFYMVSEPEGIIEAPAGTTVVAADENSQAFVTLSSAIMYGEYSDAYYNPDTKRWEVTVPIKAVTPGSQGNVSPGAISLYSGSAFDGCTNNEATAFGQDREDNKSLAERAMLAYISVDVGTHYGYARSVLDEGLVQSTKIISAGDPSMYRDWDPLVQRNIGGKVDVYIRGSNIVSSSMTKPARFSEKTTKQVMVVSEDDGEFSVLTSDVTVDQPIINVIRLTNKTKAEVYDLSNLTITGFNSFKLDMAIARNSSIGVSSLDEYILEYVSRSVVDIVFEKLPVISVSRVQIHDPETGEVVELVRGEGYDFQKKSDPYLEGSSVRTLDTLYVYYDPVNDKPSVSPKQISGETAILEGTVSVALSVKGADPESVIVSYEGPTFVSPEGDEIATGTIFTYGADYEVVQDGDSVYIRRTSVSAIPTGLEVTISYKAPDQILIEYTYDSLVPYLQEKLTSGPDQKSHITADVLVKSAVPVPVTIEMIVYLKPSYKASNIRKNIYGAIQSYINQLSVGESLYQSDIIGVVEYVQGVEYVEVPLIRMTRDIGASVNREVIMDFDLDVYEVAPIPSYKMSKSNESVLQFEYFKNAIERHFFVQLYEDNYAYKMCEDLSEVNEGYGRAKILNDGTIIVSPYRGVENFMNAKIEVSYVVGEDRTVRNIVSAPIEYLQVGFLSIAVVES